ncbi:hypothetical protein TUM17576_50540 [Enterobacter hormaechei]|nr:hypothetical protein TUM17576_50540 [Enterobacter hormaechei]
MIMIAVCRDGKHFLDTQKPKRTTCKKENLKLSKSINYIITQKQPCQFFNFRYKLDISN